MYAKPVKVLPESADWLYEIKLDGYRCPTRKNGKGVYPLVPASQSFYSRVRQYRLPRLAAFVVEGGDLMTTATKLSVAHPSCAGTRPSGFERAHFCGLRAGGHYGLRAGASGNDSYR